MRGLRFLVLILALLLAGLQWRLWSSDASLPGTWQRQATLAKLQGRQQSLGERNRRLAAEVNDLKTGLGAVEARARLDLGLVGPSETFYQVVEDVRPDTITPADNAAAAAQSSGHP